MHINTLLALMSFTLVISITPGPGNFMLLSSGASFGFRKSIPLVLGICVGFMSLILLVGMGMEHVFKEFPALYTAMKIACAIYVLKLAWKISQSGPLVSGTDASKESESKGKMATPVTLIQGALLQIVSPKAWAVAPILTVSYTNPENYLTSLFLMIPVCAIVNIPSTSVWAICGVSLRKVLAIGNRSIYFNYVMAILLLGSMIPVIIG